MSLAEHEFARRDAGGVEVRPRAVRLNWPLENLTTKDAHSLRGSFAASAVIADNPTDRKMFVEVMLGPGKSRGNGLVTVTSADLVEHFAPTVQNAARTAAAKRAAEEWASGGHEQEFTDSLLGAAKRVAFACGLELIGPFALELSSPSLQQAKLEALARARAEERAAGQVQQLGRAVELLKQFNEMRNAAPNLSAGQLLQQLSGSDRGAALETLLLAAAHETKPRPLWVVAGPYLVGVDPRANPVKLQLISLPTTLGPLRSVQSTQIEGQPQLLVGARSGVMIVDPASPSSAQLYHEPSITSDLGFNHVAVWQNRVWGCHSDAGLVAWKLGEPEKSVLMIAPEPGVAMSSSPTCATAIGSSGGGDRLRRPTPRNFTPVDDYHAVYSVGPLLRELVDDRSEPAAGETVSDIVAILPAGPNLYVVRENGTIGVLDRATREFVRHEKRGGRVCAAGSLPWMGGLRLLLACEDGPIDCVGTDDALVTRYVSNHRGLRSVSASADVIVAVSSDRQRLILWHTWDPKQPFAEVHVTAQTRHRIADVEFA